MDGTCEHEFLVVLGAVVLQSHSSSVVVVPFESVTGHQSFLSLARNSPLALCHPFVLPASDIFISLLVFYIPAFCDFIGKGSVVSIT